MSKIAVVFWSSTGNTEAMANAVAEGAKNAGADVTVYTATDFTASMVDDFDAIAFGCPAMGAEVLEETEFEPMFQDCEGKLAGKKTPCSAPTVGVMANGCAIGKIPAVTMAQTWSATASSARKPPTMTPRPTAAVWARLWSNTVS